MIDPTYMPVLTAAVGAFITGLFALVAKIVAVIIERQDSKPIGEVDPISLVNHHGEFIRGTHSLSQTSRFEAIPKSIRWLAIIVLVLVGSTAGYNIGKNIRNASFNVPPAAQANATPSPIASPTLGPTPTPIPTGELTMEINFAWEGEGNCNNYDLDKLGYEGQRYYIRQGTNGYIAVCHKNDSLLPQGSLQVTAYPDSEDTPRNYGFAVLFGWKGSGTSTTDACIFGVERLGTVTRAVYQEVIGGEWSSSWTMLDNISLDNNPHTLRVVMNEDYEAVGYLDGDLIGKHKFTHCSAGPIGLVALGSEDAKIYFDDLKFFRLP